MAFTYDLSSDVGKVRLLIPDRIEEEAIFQDAEIEAFLDLNDDNLRRAAAEALETIASDQALVLKVIRLMDLSTDGPAVAAELRERAKGLRQAADEAEAGEDDALFDYAEMPETMFQQRERVVKQAQRGEL
jgi:hypothetical protein